MKTTETRMAGPSGQEAVKRGGTDAWSLTDVITRLRRVLRSSVRHEFPWESLPMSQVEMLQRLADEPGLGIRELGTRQRLATNTVSNVIQQMVTGGLVERTPKPGDRRAVNLRLTSHGNGILTAWQAANERRLGHALKRLPPADREAIENAVGALAALASLLESDEQNSDDANPRTAAAT
ncbi:MAG: MarR family winged helix-turn-helix transcriptional regulator [Actinomycetota bacterium]|nr:MarR family winged helix-turn-helix transcriptional regulator [Actinomycetota bacterium]